MARLNTYVHLVDDEGVNQVLTPDADVPDWAIAKINNLDVWAVAPESQMPYEDMKRADLEAEIARRNEGRDDDKIEVAKPGNKPELIAALKADDQN